MSAQSCPALVPSPGPPEDQWLEACLPEELEHLRRKLESRIIGQKQGIGEIVACLARFRAGMAGIDRPIGAFLLLGPSGSGKTLTVEALAENLHGAAKAILKLHCAELTSEHEFARLKGAPPGYVGWKECVPLLHEARLREVRLRDEPALVLFDEVEKAHPALWDLLLGLLDKGEVVLNDNTRADFRKTIVFLTGNAGAREIAHRLNGGFGFRPAAALDPGGAEAITPRALDGIARRASERLFSPEFRNRLSASITYQPLTREQLFQVARLELDRLAAQLRVRHSLLLDFEPRAVAEILDAGYEPQYGARHLKRAITRLVEDPLANLIASGKVQPGDRIVSHAGAAGGPLFFRREECRG
jgi:ATP-dependent Clp protease ATP-binding subunit ClpC